MGLLTALRGAPPAVQKSTAGFPSQGYIPAMGSLPTASGMLVSQATSLQVSTVYACVRIRSRDLARCTPQILHDDGTGNKQAVLDHPLTALFRKPNRAQTWFEYCEQMHVALLLRSNAYAVILRDWRGNPVELIPLNPDLVTVLESPDGSIFYTVSRAGMWLAAVLADEDISIPAADVLHIRDLTFNSLVGVSRIALARDAIGLAMVQEQQAARWAGNGARPAGVLQSKKTLSDDAAKRLKQQWEMMQAGIQNAGRTAVLEDGIEWKAMAMNSVDLEFNASRLVEVKEIARFFEIPLHKLGENESLPRASIAELNADYVQNVVMSDATRWEQKMMATFGITDDGLDVKLDERGLLRADLSTMINSARAGVMSGLITQNEGRAYIGYGPLADANQLLAPVNLAPNGSALDGNAPDGAGRPNVGGLPGDAKKTLLLEVSAVVAAVMAKYNPDQPRDADGKFGSGGASDAGDKENAKAESAAVLSHDVKLIAEGLALTASAALIAALAPEVGAGAAVAGFVAATTTGIADSMFNQAGLASAKVILKDMGVDTKDAEQLVKPLTDLLKSADPAPPIATVLKAQLALVADHARDTLVTALTKAAPADLAEATAAIAASCEAYKAKLANLDLGAADTTKGYDPNQPRDDDGRFAGGGDDAEDGASAGGLSTRDKVHLAVGAIGLLALGVALHSKVPYKIHGGSSAILDARYRHTDLKTSLQDLHDRSVHTPLTDAERASLVKYTTNQYATINKKLRLGHKPTDDINNIDSALNKSLLADNTVVYRGVNLNRSKRLLAKTQPGDVFVDKGYPSTSLSEDVARTFAKTKDGAGTGAETDPGKHGYVMSINVDKGSNVMPLTPGHTAHDNLIEMLLPRSSAFKVLDVDHDSKTIYMQHVHLGDKILKSKAIVDPVFAKNASGDAVPDDDGGDRLLVALDDELEHFPAPDGDTTAIDYAGYRPPQPAPDLSEEI